MYTAAAALYPDALASSVTLPMEILQAASQMASVGERGRAQARFLLTAPDTTPLRLASGIQLSPDIAFDQLPPLDLLILPAIWRNPLPTLKGASRWLAQLAAIAGQGTRICSVGTASCLLAEAGLLDGRPATTHWNYFDRFARRYPRVQLKTRHLITQSDNIYCVGSVNSIADLMVHIVEGWFGTRVARAVEQQFSPEIRRSFRAAAYQDSTRSSHHDETVIQAQQYLQDNLASGGRLEDLARQLDISPRTLSRRFRIATGYSTQQYLNSLRLATARDLLRRSNLSIAEICWQLGLQDVSYFARLFRQHHGVSPMRYREAARGKLFDPVAGAGRGRRP
ncbi:GlxA family transcriptional regulator [Parahaliea aestuarii]|uniref:Helix-turn-helix domain-containing protein n=1 Tax=Parahaliea aestuarii TaxID=1852021 RepID=A0A5C8ZY00_9GAMM|nr:helix-turn-helix domain-containing protein [Parahaliea aestuarii]TXS93366.1 helix-turn-helix domain-containing protein [Parahaliea aestuarii]